jgi:hypothetical protein
MLKLSIWAVNIYGIKDQWSSFILHLVVVPNNRLSTTIGHVHLDMVEKHKCNLTMTTFWYEKSDIYRILIIL